MRLHGCSTTYHSDVTCKTATVTLPGHVTLTDIVFDQQASVTGSGHTGVSTTHSINANSKLMYQYKHHQRKAITCVAEDKIQNIQVLALENIPVLAM